MYQKIKKVYIEITNVCNLSCSFCPKTKRTPAFLELDQFKRIISQVKPYTKHVYFHIMGEPLLNPQIEAFFEECAANDLFVNLTTNGTLLAQKSDVLLQAKSLRQVNISLHSFEANEQKMTLEEYIKGVTNFAKRAIADTNMIISVRLWNMDSESIKGENELNRRILQMFSEELGVTAELEKQLLTTYRIKLGDRLYLNMAQKFEWPDIDKKTISDNVFCYGLRNQLGILSDGTVVPCCLDSEGNIALGNLFEENLDDILNKDRAKNLYEGFSRRQASEELCKKCGYAQRF